MRYNIIGKNIDVWDKTKDIVERKMDRIAKLFPEETTATITLSLEKLVSTVEVTIPLNKRLVRAEVQDGDMTAAIDKAVDILESQVGNSLIVSFKAFQNKIGSASCRERA